MPGLVELKCRLIDIKSLPSSFFAHFPNLKKVNLDCNGFELIDDLAKHLNESALTTIKLKRMSPQSFLRLNQLSVKTLQVLHIGLDYHRCLECEDLQDFLQNHKAITDLTIFFWEFNGSKLRALILMILKHLPELEKFQIWNDHISRRYPRNSGIGNDQVFED